MPVQFWQGLGLFWMMGAIVTYLVAMLWCSGKDWYKKTNTRKKEILRYHDEYFFIVSLGFSWFGLLLIWRYIRSYDGYAARGYNYVQMTRMR